MIPQRAGAIKQGETMRGYEVRSDRFRYQRLRIFNAL